MDTASSDESSPVVRVGNLSDLEILVDFNFRLAFETEDIELDTADMFPGVSTILNEPGKGLYYILEVQIKIVGFLGIQYEWNPFRNAYVHWIMSVYILPEHRRRGYCRMLFSHVREIASKQGACEIRLYTHKDNGNAIQTYHKLGMKGAYKVHGMGDMA